MNIYKINDTKFKSIYISYNFTCEVKNNDLFSRNAVLGALMAKSSKKYDNQKEIEKYLNSLYGASFDVNIDKFGDLYNIEFRVEYINSKFLPNEEDLTEDILEFLNQMIYNPKEWTEDGISREKEFIVERIRERKDEKLKYGVQRAEELLCKGEPFGTYLYGEEEIVNSLSLKELKLAYQELISNPVTIFVSGNLEGKENIDKMIENKFSSHVENDKKIEELEYNKEATIEEGVEEVHEYQDTTQSVLSMGFKINNVTPEDFYALNLYNAILGVTPSSKLFQNVREKASLAYTVRSRYYRFKNILVIYAGINKENKEKAVELIKQQYEDMKNGNITDEEFRTAKDSLMADLLEWNDSKVAMAKLKLSNIIASKNADITVDDMREKMSEITLEDVIKVASKVELKKIFVLGGEVNA